MSRSPHSGPRLPFEIIPYGEGALLVQYDVDGYSSKITQSIQQIAQAAYALGIFEDIVPAYDSLLISFNPLKLSPQLARNSLISCFDAPSQTKPDSPLIHIPVAYGEEFGPDINTIIQQSGLHQDGVVETHSNPVYTVCMMGFIPGFTFLSEAPPILHHNRHAQPRLNVPAGSVGIAGWQTGIYGLDSPGGWQIIGRSPLCFFDKNQDDPFLLRTGMRVKFVPITADEFAEHQAASHTTAMSRRI